MPSTGVVFGKLQTKTVILDSNLTDKEYFFVTFDTTDDNVVNIGAGATLPLYVLAEGGDGSSTARVGTVVLPGVLCKVKAGGSITAGDYLTSDGSGKAINASTGDNYGAVAVEGGANGDLILAVTAIGIAP